MTRIAPLLRLVAVALLGGALLATEYVNKPAPATPAPVAAGAPAAGPPTVPAPDAETATVPEPAPAPVPADEDSSGYGEPVAAPDPARADPAQADTAYAGWTEGMGLTVALAVTGDEVVAYVCDGADVEVWLCGTVTELTLQDADGTATPDATRAAGTVSLGAGTLDAGTVDDGGWFTAEPIEPADATAAGRGDVARVAERAGMDYR